MNCHLESILLSVFTSSLFIIALYIYPTKLTRNDPFVVKTRFICSCFSSLICLYILNRYDKYDLNELQVNLLNSNFLINGLIKPIFILFIIQFIPILILFQEYFDGLIEFGRCDIIFIRNYFFGPFTEEIVYRYILLKILQPCFSQINSCLISSFLFGLSHFHHYFIGRSNDNIISSFCQFIYSFLFGLFASSMYLQSTYLITPIILHSICNLIGLPDFERIASSRLLIVSTVITFCSGLGLAIFL